MRIPAVSAQSKESKMCCCLESRQLFKGHCCDKAEFIIGVMPKLYYYLESISVHSYLKQKFDFNCFRSENLHDFH